MKFTTTALLVTIATAALFDGVDSAWLRGNRDLQAVSPASLDSVEGPSTSLSLSTSLDTSTSPDSVGDSPDGTPGTRRKLQVPSLPSLDSVEGPSTSLDSPDSVGDSPDTPGTRRNLQTSPESLDTVPSVASVSGASLSTSTSLDTSTSPDSVGDSPDTPGTRRNLQFSVDSVDMGPPSMDSLDIPSIDMLPSVDSVSSVASASTSADTSTSPDTPSVDPSGGGSTRRKLQFSPDSVDMGPPSMDSLDIPSIDMFPSVDSASSVASASTSADTSTSPDTPSVDPAGGSTRRRKLSSSSDSLDLVPSAESGASISTSTSTSLDPSYSGSSSED